MDLVLGWASAPRTTTGSPVDNSGGCDESVNADVGGCPVYIPIITRAILDRAAVGVDLHVAWSGQEVVDEALWGLLTRFAGFVPDPVRGPASSALLPCETITMAPMLARPSPVRC